MFTYHSGAWLGSAAYDDTASMGLLMMISEETSTFIAVRLRPDTTYED
jgi:hypothetical protein